LSDVMKAPMLIAFVLLAVNLPSTGAETGVDSCYVDENEAMVGCGPCAADETGPSCYGCNAENVPTTECFSNPPSCGLSICVETWINIWGSRRIEAAASVTGPVESAVLTATFKMTGGVVSEVTRTDTCSNMPASADPCGAGLLVGYIGAPDIEWVCAMAEATASSWGDLESVSQPAEWGAC